jgi:superfamily II DNA or RNA helicase
LQLTLDPKSTADYKQYLRIKQLPAWGIRGRVATVPDEFAHHLGIRVEGQSGNYDPEPFLFDYQADITRMATERKRFAIFADCGLGKSLMLLSYANYVRRRTNRRILILTPPLVVPQLIAEAEYFWGPQLPVEKVTAAGLQQWLDGDGPCVGISNYEALKRDTRQGNLGALILDESSILKSHYGNYAQICLRLGQGLEWKLCCTGTPAPNDRVEYANHAVFLDQFPTINAFLATYFTNRGETGDRWEIKPHALRPFYRGLSAWSIFLTDPSVYGWQDNVASLPPIETHIHEVPLTPEQKDWVRTELGELVVTRTGGITKRASYGQIAKGFYKGKKFATQKYEFMADLARQWQDRESTLTWCLYDEEQSLCHAALGGESMDGQTPIPKRMEMIRRFKSGDSRMLISKPRILGFGLNLQVATRQIFSGLQDSYEAYYQCVKRSNRIGSTKPLNVHIPITELERPMVENVLRKASRVENDTREQEALFRESMMA